MLRHQLKGREKGCAQGSRVIFPGYLLISSDGASSKLSTNMEYRHIYGPLGANHVGDTRFTGPGTNFRGKPELGTRHMVHRMANVTCHMLLGTTCILLHGIITTVTLHFLSHLHFFFHLFWGLLFNRSLGKRRWNAKYILTYWGLGMCCWGGPCTRTVHPTFIYNALLLIELICRRFFLTQLCQREGGIPPPLLDQSSSLQRMEKVSHPSISSVL